LRGKVKRSYSSLNFPDPTELLVIQGRGRLFTSLLVIITL
jgi:hypothetical protein